MKHGVALLTVLLLVACQAESEYTSWPCRFFYDNSIHLDPVLASSLSRYSPGVFCQISETTRGGAKYLTFQNSEGETSQQLELATELQYHYQIGLNNGILVGFQSLNTEAANGGFTAYDVQCPNCVRRENNTLSPNYPVRADQKGIATCTRCGLQYQLNNNGIVGNGEKGDVGLQRYRMASTSGPQGTVSVYSQ